jgi:peptidoglycan L-alanyl-D-glutamate endopeptidase CwlK
MPFKLGPKSLERLRGVHPDLVRVVERAIGYSPVNFAVSEGLRSIERQRELVAKGFSKTLASKHLVQVGGLGHAVDVVAVGDLNADGVIDAQDKSLTWSPAIYRSIAAAMKRAAAELGVPIRWGGDFKSFFDGPHFELVDLSEISRR